jgi:hypothetical protein
MFDFPVSATPIMYGIVALHDFIMFFLVLVLCIVIYALVESLVFFLSHDSRIYTVEYFENLTSLSKLVYAFYFVKHYIFSLHLTAFSKEGLRALWEIVKFATGKQNSLHEFINFTNSNSLIGPHICFTDRVDR